MEIRAAQRTFEGAYIRTSLSQFSFALVVLKIFTSEFYSIGTVFSLSMPSLPASKRKLTKDSRRIVCSIWRWGVSRQCVQTDAIQPAVLQCGGRGRVEQETLSNEWECGGDFDGAQCSCLRNPAGAHIAFESDVAAKTKHQTSNSKTTTCTQHWTTLAYSLLVSASECQTHNICYNERSSHRRCFRQAEPDKVALCLHAETTFSRHCSHAHDWEQVYLL